MVYMYNMKSFSPINKNSLHYNYNEPTQQSFEIHSLCNVLQLHNINISNKIK